MPKVLNRHVHIVPRDAVYIGRTTPFGNPFTHHWPPYPGAVWVESRELSIELYRKWFDQLIKEDPNFVAQVEELRGKDLVCSCAPAACHGDVILAYLESTRGTPS